MPGELQTGEGGRRRSRVVTRACSEFCSKKDGRLRQQASGTAQEGCTLAAEGRVEPRRPVRALAVTPATGDVALRRVVALRMVRVRIYFQGKPRAFVDQKDGRQQASLQLST